MSGEVPVSILIPVHNGGRRLAATLATAIDEARSVGGEVIVLDDGSTDDSLGVMRRFEGEVRVESGRNQGASAARNALAAWASGAWVVFLDADDLLEPGTVRARLACAARTGADAVHSDWQGFREVPGDDPAARRERRPAAELGPNPAITLFSRFWAPPGAWLVSRALHGRVGGFRADLPVIQDARYAVDLALAGARIAHSPGVGLHYREGDPQSLSRRDPVAFADDCLRNAEQLEPEFACRGMLAVAAPALAETFEYCARSLAATAPDAAARATRRALSLAREPSRWLRAARLLAVLAGERRGLALMARMQALHRRHRVS